MSDSNIGTAIPVPAGMDLTEDKQTLILALNIAGLAFAIVFFGLRIWARFLSEASFGLDEYFMVPAIVRYRSRLRPQQYSHSYR